MGQSGQPLGARPEAVEPQAVHGQAAQRGQDANAIGLAVAVRVLPEQGVTGPVPGVLDGARVPAVGVIPCGRGRPTVIWRCGWRGTD